MQAPTLRDVYQAKKTIAPHISRTPLHYSAGLSELLDAEVYLKHDEYLPLGAFKGRGGINLLANLTDGEKERGVITASTGNHGQSVASACKMFGVRAIICLPENANPNKVAAMRALGAELIFHGDNFDAAREHFDRLATEAGYRRSSGDPVGAGSGRLPSVEEGRDSRIRDDDFRGWSSDGIWVRVGPVDHPRPAG